MVRDLGTDRSPVSAAGITALSTREIQAVSQRLAADAIDLDDAARIDRLRALEELRCSAEAALTETTADFAVSQRQLAADRGVPVEHRDRGVAAQVALARRESPRRGAQDVALAMLMRRGELPHTRAAFRAGVIDQYRATLIARETACLSAEDRATVDEQLCADPEVVEAMSIRQLVGRLAKFAAELDPAGVAERRRRAEADRHTTLRPAPDTMTWFGALLSVKNGVAVHATLDRDARRIKATGDLRSLGQIRADLLVQRVLHPGLADDATSTSAVPVMVNLVVRDTVLLGDDDGAGWVEGYGPVPGDLIREWITGNLDSQTQDDVTTWLRRVYEQPSTGRLVAMDSVARFFHGGLADFLRIRDRWCRGCGARIRHADHVISRAEGGPTTGENGQGLCECCNYAKEAPGWSARPRPGPRHTVETTTPTGHVYVSVADRL